LANEVNAHVRRLNEYLPLDAGSSVLFQEYVDPNDHPSIRTRALSYLEEVVGRDDDQLRLIVLTGDAGHGKTHLCAKLLEGLGYTPAAASAAIRDQCDGSHDLATLASGRALRIVKDLSELTVSDGARVLVDALAADRALTIVCANEGRLRSALGRERDALSAVIRSLDQGLAEGRLDVDPQVVVLNLNFQSVASPQNRLAVGLLRWAVDGRKWRACAGCDAREACPILENRRLLADPGRGPARVDATERLLQTAERIGAVITVRELLMFVAYALTGGMSCTDVHAKTRRTDWQSDYEFTQNLFGDRLTSSQRLSLRSLRYLRLIDPGAVSFRAVDDDLTPEANDAEGRFLPREALTGNAAVTTRAQAKSAAEASRVLFRFMRRRDYFASVDASEPRLRPLGFTFGNDFLSIVAGDLLPAESRRLRDQLIAGVEAVQGLRRSGEGRHLLLVDPAFGSGLTTTSIVARRIPITDVEIRSQSAAWDRKLGHGADLPQALDWSDRAVVIELRDREGVYPVQIDLLTFEYLMRAGEGLDGRAFFDAEVRRLAGAIAPLVRGASDEDQIEIVRDGRLEGLVIDTGDVIRKVVD
jgi:hypothetical protein